MNTQEQIAKAIAIDIEKPMLGNVDMAKTMELIKDIGAVLLDVRPPAKVTGNNAVEANIPNAYYMAYPTFAENFDLLPEDKDTVMIVACVKGWFANRIMGYLEVLGYENVYVLGGNIEDLIAAHEAHTK